MRIPRGGVRKEGRLCKGCFSRCSGTAQPPGPGSGCPPARAPSPRTQLSRRGGARRGQPLFPPPILLKDATCAFSPLNPLPRNSSPGTPPPDWLPLAGREWPEGSGTRPGAGPSRWVIAFGISYPLCRSLFLTGEPSRGRRGCCTPRGRRGRTSRCPCRRRRPSCRTSRRSCSPACCACSWGGNLCCSCHS